MLFRSYNANPVIQIDHSYRVEDTVGRGAARVEAGQLLVEITWGKDAKSQAVAQKVMDGLISAVSVGFMAGRSVPRSSLPSTDPLFSQEWGYVHYDNQLLEVSVVAIPANQEALAQRGVGATINIDSVVEQVLARLVTAQTLSQPSTQDKPADFLTLSLNEVKL